MLPGNTVLRASYQEVLNDCSSLPSVTFVSGAVGNRMGACGCPVCPSGTSFVAGNAEALEVLAMVISVAMQLWKTYLKDSTLANS